MELTAAGVREEMLLQLVAEEIVYARGQNEVATILTSRGHLYRIRGEHVELTVLLPVIHVRTKDSAIAIRTAHGQEAMLFESDPARRDQLFRWIVDELC